MHSMTNWLRPTTFLILSVLAIGCWRSGSSDTTPLVVERSSCLRQPPPPDPDPTIFSTLSLTEENAMLWALLEQRDAWIAAAWARCRVTR